jgi:hypothetical protein
MEIYLNDELYSRQIGAIQPDGLTAGFDIRLVTSQTYKFVFWADHVESVEGDAFLTREFAPGIGINPGFDGEINVVVP